MVALVRHPWMRPVAGVFLILLVGLVFAPSAARAACGDYVHHLPTPSPPQPKLPTKPSAPCSGPLCSPATPLPPLTALKVSVRVEDHSLQPHSTAPPRLGGVTARWTRDVRVPPAPDREPPFHPPRPTVSPPLAVARN